MRIAVDVLAKCERVEGSLGAGWELCFADSLELVSEDMRLEIAKRLALSGTAMRQLADVFLRRSDAAALWTLEHAAGLPDSLLFKALASPVLSTALARRIDLNAAIIDQLVIDGAITALVELGANLRLRLTKPQLTKLIDRAVAELRLSDDSRLARALLRRAPMTVDFAPLFLEASSSQRAQILFAAERATLGVVRSPPFSPVAEPWVTQLEQHALERQEASFIETLARAFTCDQVLAQRIVQDVSGEPLAVALAALGAPNDVCVRILTSRDMAEGPDYPRLSALARLQGALSASAAWTIVNAMLGDVVAYAPAATPAPRRTAAAAQIRGGDFAYNYRRGQIERERRSGETG